jgi:methionyl-tRNA formyltransferase
MSRVRIVFAGTPSFAAGILESLLHSGHDVVAVYTQPDRPAGRGKQLQASAVKLLATAHGLPVLQPQSLRTLTAANELAQWQADVMVVVAYGLILPQEILDTPRLGCINVHASLLPKWRGAAPIERALMAGDTHTGVTIMQMDKGLDTGPMLCTEEVEITDDDDRISVEDKLQKAGIKALLHALQDLERLVLCATAQSHADSSYAAKLEKNESLICWEQDACTISRQIRGMVGRQPAFAQYRNERIRMLKATVLPAVGTFIAGTIISADRDGLRVACKDSSLNITQIQLSGKNAVSVRDFFNAHRNYFEAGSQFDAVIAAAP